MAAAGQFVRERIPVPCTVPEAGRLVIELVGSSADSHAETAGPMTFRIVRRYRPTWATLTGFLVAPLFVRRTEVCRIAVIEARIGAELLIEGEMDVDLHESLLHLGRVPEAARVATLGPRPVPQLLAPHNAPVQEQPRSTGFRPSSEPAALYRQEPAAAAPAPGWPPFDPQSPFAPAPNQPLQPSQPAQAVQPAQPAASPAGAPRGANAFGPPMPPPPGSAESSAPEVAAASSNAASLRSAPPFRAEPAQPSNGSNGNGSNGGNGSYAGNGAKGVTTAPPPPAATQAPSPATAPPAPPASPSSVVPATAAMSPAVVEVSVDSGEQSVVGALLLIGRAPSRSDKESHAKLLTVNDPSLSVSKTHLAIGVDPAGLWVTDRHSTNGTWIDEGLGELRPVEPGVRTQVPQGARVLIGERVLTFTRQGW